MDDQGHMKAKLWPEGKHPAVPAAKEMHCLIKKGMPGSSFFVFLFLLNFAFVLFCFVRSFVYFC